MHQKHVISFLVVSCVFAMEVNWSLTSKFHIAISLSGVQPAFGVILSKVIAVSHFHRFEYKNTHDFFVKVFQICDKEKQEERVLIYIILFAGLGVVMLFSMFLQVTFLSNLSIKKCLCLLEFSICCIWWKINTTSSCENLSYSLKTRSGLFRSAG